MVRFALLSCLLSVASGCAASEAALVSMRVAVVGDDIDLYIVNTDVRGRSVAIDPGLMVIGRQLRFMFYRPDGSCVNCTDAEQATAEDKSAVSASNWHPVRLVPNQIVGRSLPVELVSEIYHLPVGCYGFFVEAEGNALIEEESVAVKLVSNAAQICLRT